MLIDTSDAYLLPASTPIQTHFSLLHLHYKMYGVCRVYVGDMTTSMVEAKLIAVLV